MEGALWVGASGLNARSNDIRIIANNIANVGTAGFKSDRAVFEDLRPQVVRQPGAASSDNTELPSGHLLGSGVKIMATQKDFSMGSLVTSDNPLDIAINGNGLFQILRPDGQMAYTRAGQFQRGSDGQIVTSSGYPLQPSMTIPEDATNIAIGIDGTVSANIGSNTIPTTIGTITIATFANMAGLQSIGENLHLETPASGAPVISNPGENGGGILSQGTYEASNVNIVLELVKLIESQRGYEMNAKSIESVNGMLQYVTQMG